MSQKIMGGAMGGVVGGIIFGMLMQMMGMMPMIAKLVGGDTVILGWIVHMVISVAAGILFVLVFSSMINSYANATKYGLAYGVFWWILGPLILMPVILGMGVQLQNAFSQTQLMSLMGHMIFGVALGLVYHKLTKQV